MASPQSENGHIDIANEIAEALMKVNLSAYESRVLWFIFRKTYGWKKKTDWLSLSQFSKCIGLDRRLIHRAIKSLSSKKMIVINRDDKNRISYGFQKNYDRWQLKRVSSKKMTRLSSKEIPTKDTVTKDKRYIVPHNKIINLYHTILDELPTVRIWSEERKKKLRTRWNSGIKTKKGIPINSLDFWETFFSYIKESDFLMGKKTNFSADLEWIVSKGNFIKIFEGKYENK